MYVTGDRFRLFFDNAGMGFQCLDEEGCVHVSREITERKAMEEELARLVTELRQSNEETLGLLEAARAILQHSEFDKSALRIFEVCRRLVGATAGYVALLSENGLENKIVFLEQGDRVCNLDPSLPMPIRGLRAEAYRTATAVYDNNFGESPWFQFMPEGHVSLDNVMFAPLKLESKTVGLLGLANKPGGFTETDARLAAAFGDLAAIGLANSRAVESLAHSEEKYRLLFSKEQDAIVVIDAESLGLVDVNEASERLWGHSRDELLRLNILDLTTEPHKTLETLKDATQGGTSSPLQQHRKKDGTVFPVEVSAAPFNWQGRTFICAIVRDVTQRKKAESLLVKPERLKAVVDLSAGVSHNFNNLLQIIIGCAGLAQANVEAGNYGDLRSYLEEIIRTSQYGAKTIKRLQTFSASYDASPDKEGSIFDLSKTAEQAIEMSRPWWKNEPLREGLRVSLKRELRSGCYVRGSENELFDVAVNLIKNAVEALTLEGEITVSTFREGNQAILEVKDNGVGISSEDIAHVFEPFFTTKGVNGTGMGLASSYGIVARHGGEITVAGEKGKGATFTVKLPVCDESGK